MAKSTQNNAHNGKIIWDYFAILFDPDGKLDIALEWTGIMW